MTAKHAGYRVVDIHVHLTPWHHMRQDAADAMAHGRKDLDTIEGFVRDPAAFVAFLDENGIARAGVINYAAPDVMGFGRASTEWGARYRDAFPDRLLAFGGLHAPADARAEVAWLLDELRIDAIKLHPPHQLVAANAYTEDCRWLAVLYEACQARRVPVMVHTGTSVFPGARGKYGDPMDCDDVAVDFPDLPLILAHGGRPLWCETAFHLVRRHANVYLDLSGIPPRRLLEYFPRLESIADRCLFGSDWPGPGIASIRANVDAFSALPLSEDALRRMLAGTADVLFVPRSG